uniref:Uncharacterized protein n=1 Tax=Anguilla anguilla TaxID=7936 RepID=A0A0E9VTA2_ANGAN
MARFNQHFPLTLTLQWVYPNCSRFIQM